MEEKINKKEAVILTKKSDRNRWIVGVIIGVVLLAGIALFVYTQRSNSIRYSQLQDKNTELTEQLAEHDSLVNSWLATLDQIESDLMVLQGKEKLLIENSKQTELTPDLRQNILNEIQSINKLLEENKAKMKDLNAKLRQSGLKIASLQTKVNELELSLVSRDSTINNLKLDLAERDFQLAELNGVVDSLHYNIREYEEKVTEQETRLNTAYIAKGEYKDLVEKGVIHKEGGFLGLGKSKALSADLGKDQFSQVSIPETQKIMLNARKAELISEHPSNSYEMVKNDSLISYLEIKNPDEFWKITRYAVVETK